ncbi:hypothetical protein BMS3Abin14_00114 [bacterium BMS3Abin14]|nr:hypothetical protein BMS3Abin14_00114 [bacterium BMS3Abin14]
MVWFLFIVSVLWIAIGSAMVLHTEKVRDFLQWFAAEANLKVWGGSIALFGVLLTVASFWSGVVWFLFIIGILIVGKGVFFLVGNEQTVRALIATWLGISEMGLRLWGLIFVVTGAAVFAWI